MTEILVTLTGFGELGGGGAHVLVGAAPGLARLPAATEATTEQPDEGPSPISPELKELVWGGGAFLVFLLAMRVFLVPKMRSGMDARYASIRGGHERADALRAGAQGEVAEYEQALAAVRAEGLARVEAAGRTLEAERTERLAAANAAIAERRSAAAAEAGGRPGGGARHGRGGRRRRRQPRRRAGHRPAPRRRHRAPHRRRGARRGGGRVMLGIIMLRRGAHRPDPQPDLPRGLRDLGRRQRLDHRVRAAVLEGSGRSSRRRWRRAPRRSRTSSTRRSRPRPTPPPRRPASARRRATSSPSAPACWPRPTSAPRRCWPTAAPGSSARSPSSTSRPTADIAAAASRSSDELRSDIAGHASATLQRVVAETLDAATQQRLIEEFIADVGRTGVAAGAGS